jgi:hypothetical protein
LREKPRKRGNAKESKRNRRKHYARLMPILKLIKSGKDRKNSRKSVSLQSMPARRTK